jgi:hypothetical protein
MTGQAHPECDHQLMSGRAVCGALVSIWLAGTVSAACDVSSAPSIAPNPVLRLTNDTNATMTVTDCDGSAPTGCVAKSTVVVAPGKQADFPRPAIAVGASPNSLAIHGYGGKTVCILIPPLTGSTQVVATVTGAQADQCGVQDLHSN